MWRPRGAGGGFHTHSREFVGAELDDEVRASLGECPDDRREAMRRQWVRRAMDEYRSMVAFAELAGWLVELREPLDVLACAQRLVRDETRHVALCTQVADALGGVRADDGEPRWVATGRNLPVVDRVAMMMIGSLCIGETLSVASIGRARDAEEHAGRRSVLGRLLADESFHSRFGFMWARRSWRSLPLRTRLAVEARIPEIIASISEQSSLPAAELERVVARRILPELRECGVRIEESQARRGTA